MRKVFRNGEIPHLWAHQRQDYARNGAESFWFQDDTIYSYREPIARVVMTPTGRVALFRDCHFSVTTSGHQSATRSAAGHLTGFTVKSLRANSFDEAIPHDENVADYRERITAAALSAKRARGNRDWKVAALQRLVDEANRYAEAFGLAESFAVPTDAALQKLMADAAEAKRRERERLAEQERIQRLSLAERLQRWLAGEHVGNLYGLPEAYLRIEGEEVVTSHGARCPLEHVRRALPLVLRIIQRGETYERNGHTIHLGHYALDRIDGSGTVYAGCHVFLRSEIDRFADLLKTYRAPAA